MSDIPVYHVHERYHEARFLLPLSPSANEAYVPQIQKRRDGKPFVRTVSSLKLQEYKLRAQNALQHQNVDTSLWSTARSLGVEAHIYVQSRASDVANREKATVDFLQEALGFNDNKIDVLHLYRHIDKHNPRVEVTLWIIE